LYTSGHLLRREPDRSRMAAAKAVVYSPTTFNSTSSPPKREDLVVTHSSEPLEQEQNKLLGRSGQGVLWCDLFRRYSFKSRVRSKTRPASFTEMLVVLFPRKTTIDHALFSATHAETASLWCSSVWSHYWLTYWIAQGESGLLPSVQGAMSQFSTRPSSSPAIFSQLLFNARGRWCPPQHPAQRFTWHVGVRSVDKYRHRPARDQLNAASFKRAHTTEVRWCLPRLLQDW